LTHQGGWADRLITHTATWTETGQRQGLLYARRAIRDRIGQPEIGQDAQGDLGACQGRRWSDHRYVWDRRRGLNHSR